MTVIQSHPPYRVLVIGCGNIAGGFDAERPAEALPLSHAGAYRQHGGFELAACADPDAKRVQAFAKRWDVPIAAADVASLNVTPGAFDVISICSPTTCHETHLQEALQLRPRLIFCEKPLTTDLAAAHQWVAACQDHKVALAVNFSRRWDPSVDALICDVKAGRWGRVRSVVAHYNKGIMNNGGHMVDVLLRLLGALDVVATLNATHDFWPDDPTVATLLKTAEGGVPVYLNPADARDYAYFELELVCELGVIRMQSGGLTWQWREVTASAQFNGYKVLNAAEQTQGRYMESMLGAIDNIYQHIQTGAALACSGDNAIQIQSLCQQIKLMAQAHSD